MNNIISQNSQDIKNILGRIKRKNFSGTTGEVIRNSTYNLGTTVIAKFGSLFFTIVIARMMGVELFGLYTLAISTILLFSITSDLGVSTGMLTFSSKALGKKKLDKAKTYFRELLRYKIYLIVFSSLIMIMVGYFLAIYYYPGKPIYYALLAGVAYVSISQLLNYINIAFQAENNFKAGMIKEIIFQLLRLVLVSLAIFYLLKTSTRDSLVIAMIVLTLAFCYFIALLYLRIIAKSQIPFLRKKASGLNKEEKQELKKFIFPLAFTALSGTFFGFIDMLMLGHYVDATHIGYYGASFALIGSATTLIGFVSGAVLPTFSRLKGAALERLFLKTKRFTFLIGAISMISTFILAKYILLIYGKEFMPGVILLQILSLILIIIPSAGIYGAYFISIKKTLIIAKLLIASTVVNIILNISFINYGLKFGMMEAVVGACIATVISRIFYLVVLISYKKLSLMK